jgi:hypothetical protein
MREYWSSFARTGVPVGPKGTAGVAGTGWAALNASTGSGAVSLGIPIAPLLDYRSTPCDFWAPFF